MSVFAKVSSGRFFWINSYFFYFAFLGVYLAYLPVLLSSHYDKAQIGTIASIFIITRIIAPIFWGYLADNRAYHVPLLRIKNVLASLCLVAMLYFWQTYEYLIVVTLLFGFFWSGTLPILESVTMEKLSGDAEQYNRIRLWGSIGFIVSIIAMGYCIDHRDYLLLGAFSVETLISLALCLCIALITLMSIFLPSIHFTRSKEHSGSVTQFLKQPVIFCYLLVALLMHMSHGIFYAFFTLHLESLSYSKSMISVYWVVGVIAEIFVFIYIQRWFKYWSAYSILVLCLVAAIIRWLMLGFYAHSPVMVFIAQLLHALTFGAFHVITMQFIKTNFPGQFQARAQSLFTMVCYGLGAAAGTYFGGFVMEYMGAAMAFSLSALQVGFALIVTLIFLSRNFLQVFD